MSQHPLPKISFGIIVFNGEPFTKYCLRNLYPYAHEIIVVEGASSACESLATRDGHSVDGTLEQLHRFKGEEDAEDKLKIVTRDGFWSEKDEQSEAYARIATGDFLWQVDIDEFYKAEDMEAVMRLLRDEPDITAISFKQLTFWGGFDYTVDSWHLKNGAEIFDRLFQWRGGYRYVTHRPPTVVNTEGVDLRTLKWLTPDNHAIRSITLFHYSLVFPRQVREKAAYYSHSSWSGYAQGVEGWAQKNFLNPVTMPYRVHNVHMHPSWIRKYRGSHPEAIQSLQKDLQQNRIQIELRSNDDIRKLEKKWLYRFGRWVLDRCSFLYKQDHFFRWKVVGLAFRIKYDFTKNRLFLKKGGLS